MSADLCNDLLEIDDSQYILENLEQQNLFIVSLDSKRSWFRYHHLFADLLYQRLMRCGPKAVSHLRRRASEWHEENRYLDEAIDYAVSAEDIKKAGELISMFSKNVWGHGKRTRLFHWFSELPVEYIRTNLDLCFLHAWVLFENGQFAEAEASLLISEQIIDSRTITLEAEEISSSFELREILGKVKAVKALLATGHGDAQRIIDYAQEALMYLPVESSTWRAIACFSLGLAHSIDGDNAYAVELFSRAREDSKLTGDMDLYFRASYWLIGRLKYVGKLQEAIDTCQDLLQFAEERKLENTLVWGGACVFWGDLLYERNQLNEAHRFINKEIEMIEIGHDVGRKGWGYYCLMRVLVAKKEIANAEDIIAKMEELQLTANLPGWITQLTESFKAKIWLSKGKLDKIEEWLDQNEISVTGSILSLQYLGYMILARFLLAQGKTREAKEVLDQLIFKQQKTKRILLLIETLLIKAFVLKSEDDDKGAVLTFAEALKRAESGGYIRVFLDEGPSTAELLEMVLKSDVDAPRSFVRKLLTASLVDMHAADEAASAKNGTDLSERELEVLRLIAGGLTNKKIMEKLYISLSTVKTHLRNIYSKLDAHSRTEAVAKANELHLL
jgi:LuxR family maltose regulon positive regulatory protein